MGTASSSGSTLKNSGLVLLLIGYGILFVNEYGFVEFKVSVLLSVLALALMVTGAFMFYIGRQYAPAQVSTEAIVSDAKPDLLYLRSFKVDPSAAGQAFSALRTPNPLSGTEEEQLAEVLKPFGDLVALGQPGESLPPPGAAKLYASHEEWQRVVIEQMKTAKLVVIRAGIHRAYSGRCRRREKSCDHASCWCS
jgi:hypothetical protein